MEDGWGVKKTHEYKDLFDALAAQVCEDLVVMKVDPITGKDYAQAIHLMAPNGWSAGL